MIWSYGIVTFPEREDTTLPRTLNSLYKAGFEDPKLFVDTEKRGSTWNWLRAFESLYHNNEQAARYVVFEDDILAYCNLKRYLEGVFYPENGYLNLYLSPMNQKPAKDFIGWCIPRHPGKGCLALVFNKETARLLSQHLSEVAQYIHPRFKRQSTDGGIQITMKHVGIQEYVHHPSLVQHVGMNSSFIGENAHFTRSLSFRGEDFDALDLLKEMA